MKPDVVLPHQLDQFICAVFLLEEFVCTSMMAVQKSAPSDN